MTKNISCASMLAFVLLLSASCATTDADKVFKKRNQQLKELAKKRHARESELAAMSVAQLANELRKDSDQLISHSKER